MDQHTLATTGRRKWRVQGKEVVGSHVMMMGWGMVLREIIGKIISTLSPMNNKHPLRHPVPDPVKVHVDRFGSALFHCAIGDASGAGVIGLDRGGWLGMAHVF